MALDDASASWLTALTEGPVRGLRQVHVRQVMLGRIESVSKTAETGRNKGASRAIEWKNEEAWAAGSCAKSQGPLRGHALLASGWRGNLKSVIQGRHGRREGKGVPLFCHVECE
jgi:hypothetical protein